MHPRNKMSSNNLAKVTFSRGREIVHETTPINGLQKVLEKHLSKMTGEPYSAYAFLPEVQSVADGGVFLQYEAGRGVVNIDILIEGLSSRALFQKVIRYTEIRGQLIN